MRIILVAICLYMLFGYSAFVHAQQSTVTVVAPEGGNKTAMQIAPADLPRDKRLSVTVDMSADSAVTEDADGTRETSGYIYFLSNYHLTSILDIGVRVGVERIFYDDNRTSLSNTQVVLSRPNIVLNSANSLILSSTAILPTNEIDRLDSSFEGAIGVAASVKTSYALAAQEGSLNYTISALKNFHQYDRSIAFGENLSHRVRATFGFDQALGKYLSIDATAFYQTGWTYFYVVHGLFHIEENINFLISKNTTLYLGHSNEGDELAANGVDENVKIYDKNTSVVRAGVRATY